MPMPSHCPGTPVGYASTGANGRPNRRAMRSPVSDDARGQYVVDSKHRGEKGGAP